MKTNVIESVELESTEWGISFTNHNPEPQDYFKMPDKETAFRLQSYLAALASTPCNDWIGVESGLPGCGQHLVAYTNPSSTDKRLYVIPLWRGRDNWYYDNAEKELAQDETLLVTHYQPLPSPPSNQ